MAPPARRRLTQPGQATVQAPRSVTVQSAGSFLYISWNPVFSERRFHNYKVENKPYLEYIAAELFGDEVGSLTWLTELENAIREFLRGVDDSDICTPEADIVLGFCSGSSFERLLGQTGTAS